MLIMTEMKRKYQYLIFSYLFLFSLTSCEKEHDFFEEPSGPDYFDEAEGLMFMVDSTSFWPCVHYRPFWPIEALKVKAAVHPSRTELGQISIVANSEDNCSYPDTSVYSEEFSLKFNKGTIYPEIQTINLKNGYYLQSVLYSHQGKNLDGDFGLPRGNYEDVIDGEFIIDSVFFGDPVHELRATIWGTFWMDLEKLNYENNQLIGRDTIHIHNGYFKIPMS